MGSDKTKSVTPVLGSRLGRLLWTRRIQWLSRDPRDRPGKYVRQKFCISMHTLDSNALDVVFSGTKQLFQMAKHKIKIGTLTW